MSSQSSELWGDVALRWFHEKMVSIQAVGLRVGASATERLAP